MTSEIVNRLRKNSDCLAPCLMDEAADEIVRLEQVVLALTAERDDARQEACCLLSSTCDLEAAIPVGTIVHSTGPSPEHFARIRGWDCFQDIAIDSEDGAP
jgi:hypothetical protein